MFESPLVLRARWAVEAFPFTGMWAWLTGASAKAWGVLTRRLILPLLKFSEEAVLLIESVPEADIA